MMVEAGPEAARVPVGTDEQTNVAKEEARDPACQALAAELELANMEIAALEHDNELLSSENKILIDQNNLDHVIADIREYLAHVLEGDDVVPP